MKKEVISKLLIIFISIIILTGFISAEDGCTIRQDNCLEGEYRVMGLSAQTNAHGQVWNASAYGYLEYDYILCCNFGEGDTSCSSNSHPEYGIGIPSNKIIGLSSETNAHAEILGESNYPVDVCYDGLSCMNIYECGGTYPIGILSLSDDINAHIGEINDYGPPDGSNICCKNECEGIGCMGASICDEYGYKTECECDKCNVADESIFCEEGDICLCEWVGEETEGKCVLNVEEAVDPNICGDNRINPELGETCDGTSLGDWDCTDYGFTGGILSCYDPETVNKCTHDTSLCTGGTSGICGDGTLNSGEGCDCGGDVCTLEELNSKTCEDFSLLEGELACYSPTHANNCTFDTTGCEPSESHPSKIGKCTYDESTDDNCDDKFLTYSWNATWTWDEGNPEHYDPNNAAAKCIDGYDTVPCPAQIELPFFGSYSIVVIIALIALVYVFLKFKEKEKLKKKPSSKKKKK